MLNPFLDFSDLFYKSGIKKNLHNYRQIKDQLKFHCLIVNSRQHKCRYLIRKKNCNEKCHLGFIDYSYILDCIIYTIDQLNTTATPPHPSNLLNLQPTCTCMCMHAFDCKLSNNLFKLANIHTLFMKYFCRGIFSQELKWNHNFILVIFCA